jgi:SAM-dependent methyltransferase
LKWKVQKNLERKGLGGVIRLGWLKVGDVIQSVRSGERRMLREAQQYDRRFNITTSYHVPLDELAATDRPPDGYDYQPTHPPALRRILGHLKIHFPDFMFVDLGCGMGRAVFVAAEFPFHGIVGVEYSMPLFRIASENARTFKSESAQCRSIKMLCLDAAQYPIPDHNVVFYIYNPFGKHILDRVVRNIEYSLENHSRRIVVLYHNPAHAEVLDDSPRWNKVATGSPQPGSHGFSIYENRVGSSRTP